MTHALQNNIAGNIAGNSPDNIADSIADIKSLRPELNLNRRGFMATTAASTVGIGFAAAVQPVQAQTAIKTDASSLRRGEVNLIGKDGYHFAAYVAAPEGKSNLPVVIVLSEIFGVHEHIADVCRRFAKLGYLAIAPEYFSRAGDAKKQPDMAKLMSDIVGKTPDAQVMSDTDVALAWAQANGGSDKVAVTGFCWGGRITWLYTAHNPKVKAGAAWYGRLVGAASANFPQHPVDLAGKLNAPVLGLYGGIDTGIPLDTVEKMEAALKAAATPAAKASYIHVYDQSPHAFHADYRPSYRKADAEAAWARTLAFFKANGVA
jgi:carboxymethylenebutenolidase